MWSLGFHDDPKTIVVGLSGGYAGGMGVFPWVKKNQYSHICTPDAFLLIKNFTDISFFYIALNGITDICQQFAHPAKTPHGKLFSDIQDTANET